jgi:hypothetical protein
MRFLMYILLLFPMPLVSPAAHAQPSSAPPSSLAVNPLSPTLSDPAGGHQSCDLCRRLEGRPGSDLERHRRPLDPRLHPNKKAPGMTKSLKRSFKSQLPHRKLEEHKAGSEP